MEALSCRLLCPLFFSFFFFLSLCSPPLHCILLTCSHHYFLAQKAISDLFHTFHNPVFGAAIPSRTLDFTQWGMIFRNQSLDTRWTHFLTRFNLAQVLSDVLTVRAEEMGWWGSLVSFPSYIWNYMFPWCCPSVLHDRGMGKKGSAMGWIVFSPPKKKFV